MCFFCFLSFLSFSCADVDECAVDEDNCHRSRGICSDIVGSSGSFQCSCIPGYTGDGVTSCRNTDECSEQLDSCDVNANCVDTFGSYVCLCRAGFKSYGPVVGEICVSELYLKLHLHLTTGLICIHFNPD